MAPPSTDNRGPEVVGVAVAMMVISILAVALRFWSRSVSRKAGYWWDDWTALASLPFVLVICAGTIYWVSIGFGKHAVPGTGSASSRHWVLFAGNFIYNTALTLIKISVLLFYARVFGRIRSFRIALWVTAALVISWFIAINLLALLTCIPIRKAWTPSIPGRCTNLHKGFLGTAISNVITDIILLLLPLPMLWQLHIGIVQKWALVGVFVLGYCVVIVSTLRLVTIVKSGEGVRDDFTWNFVDPQILVIIETSIALLSICLPTIFGLVKRVVKNRTAYLFGAHDSSHPSFGPRGTTVSGTSSPSGEHRMHNTKGFLLKLQGSRKSSRASDAGTSSASYCAAAVAVQGDSNSRAVDPELGIETQQIYVRNDIEVNSERSGV